MEESNNNKLIYLAIGTFALTALSAYFVYRKFKSTKNSNRIATRTIDLSAFDSPDMPGSGNCMDSGLLMKLQQLEMRTGYPIFDWINSGARSESHNRKVGGVSSSSHKIPTCKAVDIGVPSTHIRDQLVYEARNIGFKRIGVGKTFVHLDTDENKSQYVAWGYPSGTSPDVNPFV
ncbi:Peptidase M15A [Kordia algicida OT-1]|uniref:Peptidase M15A n=1 Tax=Kordia algicida OT-1 TaxID=391587 RepID=A9DWE4_9FLAO|nr:Peptidase M15A [Kordia algicida OT-1]